MMLVVNKNKVINKFTKSNESALILPRKVQSHRLCIFLSLSESNILGSVVIVGLGHYIASLSGRTLNMTE
jgi:hypothetical protein